MNPPPAKRPRLSMACNSCRRRKVKCDAEQPKCRNCSLRNDECRTEDPRRPDEPVVREWIDVPQQPQVIKDVSPYNLSGPSPPAPGVSTNADSVNEAFGISPVHQGHDVTYHHDVETNRIKMMGASSSQSLMKSLDVYLKAAGRPCLSSHFAFQMRHSEELALPSDITWPALPSLAVCDEYLTIFFTRIHPVYPIFDVDHFKDSVRHMTGLPYLNKLPAEHIPVLVSAYLVVGMCADEKARKSTEEGTKYLQAAASLLGYVITMPYLASVQCLLLFTLFYRGRNKDGAGWQTLGMAIRIAHTLGLHRFSSKQSAPQHGIKSKYQQLFHARVWGVCCCLEKIMQLESGRPSSIVGVDRDQMMGAEQRPPRAMHDFLQWHVGLAEFQSQISHYLYDYGPGTRSTGYILREAARLDAALLSWANEIPSEFRPTSDLSFYSKNAHAAAHLSMQYHQAMIALHRAALIAPPQTIEREIEEHCPELASDSRIRRGEAICVHSARAIARLSVELVDNQADSRLLTISPPLLACIVLSLFLLKSPSNRLRASDLELLRACAESTAEQCISCDTDQRFANATLAMYEQVKAYLADKKSQTTSQVNGQAVQHKDSNETTNSNGHNNNHNNMSASEPWSAVNGSAMQPTNNRASHGQQASGQGSDGNTGHSSNYGNEAMNPIHLPPSMPEIGRYDDQVMSEQVMQQQFDATVPFTGLNVEDLWNWMMVTDVTGGSDDYQLMQPPPLDQMHDQMQSI